MTAISRKTAVGQMPSPPTRNSSRSHSKSTTSDSYSIRIELKEEKRKERTAKRHKSKHEGLRNWMTMNMSHGWEISYSSCWRENEVNGVYTALLLYVRCCSVSESCLDLYKVLTEGAPSLTGDSTWWQFLFLHFLSAGVYVLNPVFFFR
jgi:hypothetical protein